MYEYMRTRGGLGTFDWSRRSCSGGSGVSLGAGEMACVPASDRPRAVSRGCTPVPSESGNCDRGVQAYCCPERAKVRELQQAIVAAGCQLPRFGVDGLWGTETAQGAQCLVERDGWSAISSRFEVVRGLIEPPTGGHRGAQAPMMTGSTRLIRREPLGDGMGAWGYVGIGAAALVLGFAISQMMKKDETEGDEELDVEDERMAWLPPQPARSTAY